MSRELNSMKPDFISARVKSLFEVNSAPNLNKWHQSRYSQTLLSYSKQITATIKFCYIPYHCRNGAAGLHVHREAFDDHHPVQTEKEIIHLYVGNKSGLLQNK